jgi:hypothetical protein
LKITDAAVGEVLQYLQFLKEPRGALLFSKDELWLISCEKHIHEIMITSIDCCKWSLPGSVYYLKEFIAKCSSINLNLLKDACLQFAVKLVNQPYLGRGAIGRVYQVRYRDNDVALKIVTKEAVFFLYHEHGFYESVKDLDCVASAVSKPVELLGGHGCAMMIEPVGRALYLERPLSSHQVRSAVDVLCSLHKAGFTHGDPRVENLIITKGGLKWIDFNYLVGAYKSPSQDCKILAGSLLQREESNLPSSVVNEIEAYVNTLDANRFASEIVKHLSQSSHSKSIPLSA